MWSYRKYALAGIFSALGFLIQTAFTYTVTLAIGPAASSPVIFFVWSFISILFRFVVAERGAITLIAIVGGLLTLPTGAYGPPAFLPKIVPLIVGAMVMDGVFEIMKGRALLASVLSPMAGIACSVPILVQVLLLFQIPGASILLNLLSILVALGAVLGAVGGYLGGWLYEKIADRPSIQRIREQ